MKEEEDHSEHWTQQEDRVVLSVDVKGLVGLWDHGDYCSSWQVRGLRSPSAVWCCFNRANPWANLHSVAYSLTRLGVNQLQTAFHHFSRALRAWSDILPKCLNLFVVMWWLKCRHRWWEMSCRLVLKGKLPMRTRENRKSLDWNILRLHPSLHKPAFVLWFVVFTSQTKSNMGHRWFVGRALWTEACPSISPPSDGRVMIPEGFGVAPF